MAVRNPSIDRVGTALRDVYRAAEAQIHAELVEILDDPKQSARIRRLRSMAAEVDRRSKNIGDEARHYLNRSLIPSWESGAKAAGVASFSWTQGHRQALGALALDTHRELLKSTRYMSRDVKALIRAEGAFSTRQKVAQGKTIDRARTELVSRLRDIGVTSVTYRDGRNIRASTYADMLLRTKTAVAYNMGGLNQMHGAGIRYVEGIDGADCGLVTHDDGFKVNGKILPLDVASTYTIGHPNCRRDWAARPDITDDAQADKATSWRDPDQVSDQANFERYLRETPGVNRPRTSAGGRTARTPRTSSTARSSRTPRTPRTLSA